MLELKGWDEGLDIRPGKYFIMKHWEDLKATEGHFINNGRIVFEGATLQTGENQTFSNIVYKVPEKTFNEETKVFKFHGHENYHTVSPKHIKQTFNTLKEASEFAKQYRPNATPCDGTWLKS